MDLPFAVGPNGLAFDSEGDLLLANTDTGSIIRLPVKHNGKAGKPRVHAGPDCANLEGADGIDVDDSDNVYVVVNRKNTSVRISRDGSIETLATAANGLDFPASVHFGEDDQENDLYFTNFAIGTVVDPNPALLKVSIGDDERSDSDDESSDD